MRPQDFAPRQAYAVIAPAPPAIDPDAQAIIDDVLAAGGTLSAGDQTAINTFIVAAKAANLYSRCIDGTLVLGGTAAAVAVDFVRHGQNVVDSYTGVPTVSANGIQGDGATTWATLYKNADQYNAANMAVDVLNASNNTTAGAIDYGAANAVYTEFIQIHDINSANAGNVVNGNGLAGDYVISTGIVNTQGMHTMDRQANVLKYYFNGILNGTNGALTSSVLPSLRPYLMARNHNGTAEFKTTNLLQFFCTRESFTPLDTATWYNLVYQLQVDLGRNTY